MDLNNDPYSPFGPPSYPTPGFGTRSAPSWTPEQRQAAKELLGIALTAAVVVGGAIFIAKALR